jgi:uncharacterized membrane protein YhhN
MLSAFLAAAVAALVVADQRGSRLGIWLAKPLASSLFIAAALANGATASSYGWLVLAALALSWLGDVLLIPHDDRVFRAGVGAFGLAHVAYLAAFALRGIDPLRAALAALAAALAVAAAARWLRPHVPPDMKLAVNAYMAIISAMVVGAVGASRADPRILVGALLFYASDLLVARQRFVAPSPWNPAVGLPLYYAAQLVLASTV